MTRILRWHRNKLNKLPNRGRLALLGAALALVGSPAHAEWQFTRWGMSPTELVAASEGKALPDGSDPHWKLRIPGPYAIGSIKFDSVQFRFDDADKLHRITLNGVAADWNPTEAALAGSIGPPTKTLRQPTMWVNNYIDATRHNAIELMRINDKIFLTYTPQDIGF